MYCNSYAKNFYDIVARTVQRKGRESKVECNKTFSLLLKKARAFVTNKPFSLSP